MDVNTSTLSDEEVRTFWLEHGGRETYIQYMELREDEQRAIVEYLRERPMYKILGKNILVHAGVFYGRYTLSFSGGTDEAAKAF